MIERLILNAHGEFSAPASPDGYPLATPSHTFAIHPSPFRSPQGSTKVMGKGGQHTLCQAVFLRTMVWAQKADIMPLVGKGGHLDAQRHETRNALVCIQD